MVNFGFSWGVVRSYKTKEGYVIYSIQQWITQSWFYNVRKMNDYGSTTCSLD